MRSPFAPLIPLLPLTAALLLTACPSEAPEVHAFTSGSDGFDTTSWWVDTGAEVVVFDAQFTPELAEALIADVEAQTDSPIRYVVVTHPNPDKFNGATAFQAIGAEVVASRATADAMPGVHAYKEAYFVGAGVFAPGTYPALPEVDLVFDDALTLDLDGGFDVQLRVLEHPGVSSTQTVGLLPGAVVAGDLAFGEAHAWLEGGIVDGAPQPDLPAWGSALGELLAFGGERVLYPGRGAPAPVAEAVPAQQAYLRAMDALVGDYVAGLDDPMAELTGPDAGDHYAALTAEAEAAFPTYDLSYLITYGVYGLALSKASP